MRLKFITNLHSHGLEPKEDIDEMHSVVLKSNCDTVTLSEIMGNLDSETQQKMEGKIISYYHYGFQSYVYLGCTLENPKNAALG